MLLLLGFFLHLLRVLMRLAASIQRLLRKLMRGQMVILFMRSCRPGVSLRGDVVKLLRPYIACLWHRVLLFSPLDATHALR